VATTPDVIPPGAIGLMVGTGNAPLDETLALARRADQAGIGALGAGDGVVENLSVMGALAAVTSSADLVTAIVGWTRTPVTTALAGRTMQELSGGRYRLGLGTMPRAWSEDWHDVPAPRPLARMRDYVAAVRRAWDARPGEPVSHEGDHYRFAGYAQPTSAAPPASPPISLAVSRPRMAHLAGEVADGVLFNLISSPEWITQQLLPAVREGRGAALTAGSGAGPARPFELSTIAYCVVDDDVERARDLIRPALGFYFTVPYFADALRHHGFERELAAGTAAAQRGDLAAMAAAISDEVVDAFALAGPETQVRRRLAAYLDPLDRVLLCPPIVQTSGRTIELSERIVALAAS
jgi:alkanesulfonate monooxygenase SsuD/methylene tetrahydromethanopterin reductase-like flavin-dependent oxidoreductase (luciferase family)